MKKIICALIFSSFLLGASYAEMIEIGDDFNDKNFDSSKWQEAYCSGDGGGKVIRSEGKMDISVSGADKKTIYGIYTKTAFRDTFDARVDFDYGEAKKGCSAGIMVVKSVNGKPDFNNYARIFISGEKELMISRQAREDGVLGALSVYKEYSYYSPKYKVASSGVLRISRDNSSSCLRFLHGYTRKIDGKDSTGWKELDSLRDRGLGQVHLYVWVESSGESDVSARFDNVVVKELPAYDKSDAGTGFGAMRRDYTFSGATGDAVVVTFDKAFRDYENAKFVFWKEANYIPWWHIDKRCAFNYGFLECWEGGTTGCCEPMSDRNCRWSRVEILESNRARVVVGWFYMLNDINYNWWGGHEKTWGEEYFYFYPDGVAIRKIVLKPVACHLHEIAEFMVVNAGGTKTSEHLNLKALTLFNLEGEEDSYAWDLDQKTVSPPFNENTWRWKEIMTRVHLKNRPTPFFASNLTDKKNKNESWPMLPLRPDPWTFDRGVPLGFKWPMRNKPDEYRGDFWHFAHWPVSKMPYEHPVASSSHFLREASHSSLISWKPLDDPYGESVYVTMIGLTSQPDSYIKDVAGSWLYPGEITVNSERISYNGYDYAERAYVLTDSSGKERNEISFSIQPARDFGKIVNPAFIIKNRVATNISISIDGSPLSDDLFRYDTVDRNLIIWINKTITVRSEFRIRGGNP